MEISDYTEILLTDRGKVWNSTLQRITHEIKTPLSTIIFSVDNIKSKLHDKNANIDEELSLIQNKLKRLKQLTKNFMVFTNVEKPLLKKVSILEILNNSIIIFKSYFQNEMLLTFDVNNYYVLADPVQLSQFFPLLIENSIDACKGKGELYIKTERVNIFDKTKWEKSFANIETNKSIKVENEDITNTNNYIKIIIKDDGHGMSHETLQKIFQPYFTTKKDGTGIGISLAKKIVEDNKGWLDITSEIGKGTTLTVYLQEFKKININE